MVTLKPSYLQGLSVGKHRLAIVSKSGVAVANFTVKAAAAPTTPQAPTQPGGSQGTAKPTTPTSKQPGGQPAPSGTTKAPTKSLARTGETAGTLLAGLGLLAVAGILVVIRKKRKN